MELWLIKIKLIYNFIKIIIATVKGDVHDIGKNIDDYLGTFANSIPRRDSKGNLFTGTPIDEQDCANKKYVDEAVASSGGGGGSITVDQTYNAESENAQTATFVYRQDNSEDPIYINMHKKDKYDNFDRIVALVLL